MDCRIEDYALIGDCETAALVSRNGSIDWLCLPRFDAPACFAALLGEEENGSWSIHPDDPDVRVSRRYRDGTLILETRFETATGAATLIDFMAVREPLADLVRIVVGEWGVVNFTTQLIIRFDYGRTVPWVTRADEQTLSAIAGPDQIVIHTPVALKGEDHRTVGHFTVRAGERTPFAMTYQSSLATHYQAVDPEAALAHTEEFWRAFSDRCPDVGSYTEQVKRSLITLKALTYGPTGGMVAAATTSLPEWIGGPRNWDYRYCWLRDATFTLQAFMQLGYFEEAKAWRDWLLRAVAGDPSQLQIMYGVGGERQLPEWEAPWLSGYRGSQPVRIGNAAAAQLQLDVFGEVSDALMQAAKGGLPPHERTGALREVGLEYLESIWREPDSGIWEVRGEKRHFVHSKVMAWVAFDRAASIEAKTDADRASVRRWRAVADKIHREVCAYGFSVEQNSFVQSYGSTQIDASLLQLALVGFLPAEDSRILGTIEAVESELMWEGLVKRYRTSVVDDGLPPGEGVFLACSFWLVDNLALIGRWDDARALLDRLSALSNDVGLFAEEYDPIAGDMLGNFPQAFSHVGLINSALNLHRRRGPARARASHDIVPQEARVVAESEAERSI
ncbi:MAG: putative glycosyl hydrolase [Hyphomicrobiales bacterium]|nr:putative glycosyl hydrolase [Hyphomicrobiales bacterium]